MLCGGKCPTNLFFFPPNKKSPTMPATLFNCHECCLHRQGPSCLVLVGEAAL